ncbi:lar interacting protein lip -related protein [Anaeramoeba flamelloides]|uniref:Lar interacting protein lip -related protein n=1 Tax=Anaeramoeba flamelloides TaxID=1746091 RepID=A0ABQ8XW75_9EUKA|nr:lar interacting protein lip -related protein [Anaeramoeba flamelloides]
MTESYGNELANTLANQSEHLKQELKKVQDRQRTANEQLTVIKQKIRELHSHQSRKINQIKNQISEHKKQLLTQTEIYQTIQQEISELEIEKNQLDFELEQLNNKDQKTVTRTRTEKENTTDPKKQFQSFKEDLKKELTQFQELMENENQLETLEQDLEKQDKKAFQLNCEREMTEKNCRIQELVNFKLVIEPQNTNQEQKKDQNHFSKYNNGIIEYNRLCGEKVAVSLHLKKQNKKLKESKNLLKEKALEVTQNFNNWKDACKKKK